MKRTIASLVCAGLLITATGPAQANDDYRSSTSWDTADKLLMGSAMSLLIADMGQTKWHMERPDRYRERNPILRSLGEDSVAPYFAATTAVSYIIADKLDQKWRKVFLVGVMLIEGYCVAHNQSDGVHFSLKF